MPTPSEPETVRGRRPTPDPLLGSVLDGRYTIEARLATGGFGAVYRARTPGGVPVAVKVLHPGLSRDPSMVVRFRREGATLLQLHDHHTVTTLAVGEAPDGTLYIAMELLVGESLHDRLHQRRQLAWRDAVAIARAVCSSLAEAHALGVVHRDLKPANIQLEPGERVKVIDFGIAKIARGSAVDDGHELTFAGHMIGTCDYMSPEQVQGGDCGPASDVYALGVVLYEMLTGARPFADVHGPGPLMTAMLTRTPAPPARAVLIPAELDRIVLRCLAREPEDRYAQITELAAALDRLVEPDEAPTMIEPAREVEADTIRDDVRRPDRWLEPRTIVDLPRPRRTPTGTAAPPPSFATLPGIAVPTPSRPIPALVPWPTAAPPWPAPPMPVARGSAPRLPTRRSHVLWYALVVLCVAAVVIAAMIAC